MRFHGAVLGSPIEHSLSPKIHNFAYQRLGFDGDFSKVEVQAGELQKFLENQDSFQGFALTAPLKEELVSIAPGFGIQLDPMVIEIGSANTLYRKSENFHCTSTDLSAMIRLFKQIIFNEKITIIGAGGTARAILGALSNLNLHQLNEIQIVNRTENKVDRLKQDFPTLPIIFQSFTGGNYGRMKFNTLPISALLELEISEDSVFHISETDFIFNALYAKPERLDNPLIEQLFDRAAITGQDLLIEQALDQISIFTGLEFDYETLRQELKQLLS
jgi:shikimate dehydrogenase